VRLLRHQLKWEQRLFWRSRESAIFVFLFPILLFTLLTAIYTGRIYGHPASWALLAGMIGYGAANTAFAGLGITLVSRREIGILKRIRATPLPPATYLTAVLVSITLVFAIQVASLFALGRLLKSTPWPSNVLSLVLALALGAACFAALGLAITGFIRSLEGSSAVLNVIVLPMAFLTGSFGPTRHYPKVLRAIGDVLPLKPLLDLVNGIYLHGAQIWDKPAAVAVLGGWGLFGMAVALRTFRWEPREG
jgi:ABC-2 type transport system permease protein